MMNTKLSLALSLCLFCLFASCLPPVRGNGNLVTENINIADYRNISIGGGNVTLNYVQSDEQPGLTIVTDKNIFELYTFEVQSGTLNIRPKKRNRTGSIIPTEFTITTNSTAISKISIAGKATVNMNSAITSDDFLINLAGSGIAYFPNEVNVDKFHVKLAGSATVDASNLHCKKYEADLAGSGTLITTGESESVTLSIAGSGTVKAEDLQTKELHAKVAGSGDIRISVSEKIYANIAGSGKIRYKGNPPTIERKIAGSGSIKPIE